MRAGAHGGTRRPDTSAGGTGLPPGAEAALVGAEPAGADGEPGAGGGVRPRPVSQSAVMRSTSSAVTVSAPSPHVARSETSPLTVISSSPAPPLIVSTPLLPVSTSGPAPPV